jgi:hypothetical protein
VKTVRTLVLGAALFCAPLAVHAQDEDPAGLSGTWKRTLKTDGGTPRFVRLDLDRASGELVGKMLNPPTDPTGKPYGVDVRLKLEGKKLAGRATWSESNPKSGEPGQPEKFTCDTRWELDVEGPDKLSGKVEWIEWAEGKVLDRGFEEHVFERLPDVSLGARGQAAPEKVEAGLPIDAGALAGAWKTPQGWIVTFKQDEDWALVRVKGEGDFPTKLTLANASNVLKGGATWASGASTNVELKLSAPGRLEGRVERVQGGHETETFSSTWEPWALERLPRIDGPADANAPPPPALAAGTGNVAIALDWKRDDGLYLKLAPRDGGGYTGELVSKSEGVRAKVELAASDQKLTGKATFTVIGTPVEASWELAPQADGTIDARCEWLDWDPATKTVVARGFVARKFKPLRRVG